MKHWNKLIWTQRTQRQVVVDQWMIWSYHSFGVPIQYLFQFSLLFVFFGVKKKCLDNINLILSKKGEKKYIDVFRLPQRD